MLERKFIAGKVDSVYILFIFEEDGNDDNKNKDDRKAFLVGEGTDNQKEATFKRIKKSFEDSSSYLRTESFQDGRVYTGIFFFRGKASNIGESVVDYTTVYAHEDPGSGHGTHGAPVMDKKQLTSSLSSPSNQVALDMTNLPLLDHNGEKKVGEASGPYYSTIGNHHVVTLLALFFLKYDNTTRRLELGIESKEVEANQTNYPNGVVLAERPNLNAIVKDITLKLPEYLTLYKTHHTEE